MFVFHFLAYLRLYFMHDYDRLHQLFIIFCNYFFNFIKLLIHFRNHYIFFFFFCLFFTVYSMFLCIFIIFSFIIYFYTFFIPFLYLRYIYFFSSILRGFIAFLYVNYQIIICLLFVNHRDRDRWRRAMPEPVASHQVATLRSQKRNGLGKTLVFPVFPPLPPTPTLSFYRKPRFPFTFLSIMIFFNFFCLLQVPQNIIIFFS